MFYLLSVSTRIKILYPNVLYVIFTNHSKPQYSFFFVLLINLSIRHMFSSKIKIKIRQNITMGEAYSGTQLVFHLVRHKVECSWVGILFVSTHLLALVFFPHWSCSSISFNGQRTIMCRGLRLNYRYKNIYL